MREEILDFLRRKSGDSFSLRQLLHHLKVSKNPNDQRAFKIELRALVEEGKIILDREQNYMLRDESRVVKGTIKLHPEGFGFLIPEERGRADVFIPQRGMNFAMNNDTVLAESFRNPRDGRFEGRILQIVKHAHEIVVGTFKKAGKQGVVRFSDRKLGLTEINIPAKGMALAAHDDYVAVKILQYPGPGILPIGEIIRVIGVEVDEKTLKEAVLVKHKITKAFPEGVHRELGHLPAEVEDVLPAKRVDLRERPIVTIDGVTAKDFDDAVCAERHGKGYVLWVSIADVAEYVPMNSSLDKEAFRRSTSTYLPDECVPMLPEKLSNGLCSLNPHLPRYTLTAEIHYNGNADVIHSVFYKSLIKSRKRMTYDEVQAYYDGTGGTDLDAQIRNSLDVMKDLAERLMLRTEARGTMNFDLPEAEFIFDSTGAVSTIAKRQRFFSHKLIEQFMIAANVVVAQLFSSRHQPLLYRIHDIPDSLKVQSFLQLAQGVGLGRFLQGFHPGDFFKAIKGDRLETFLQGIFLRSMKQAIYSPENIGHFGLALKDYAHFTSPIRRYPDLTVHRQLRSLLEQSPTGQLKVEPGDFKRDCAESKWKVAYSLRDLVAIGHQSSQREREAMEAEREVSDIKRAFFIRNFLHQKFLGRITRITKFGVMVEIEPHFVEGFVPMGKLIDDYYVFDEKKIQLMGRKFRRILKIGDSLWVEVSEVDLAASRIELTLAGQTKPANVDHKKNGSKKGEVGANAKKRKKHQKKHGKRKGKPKPKLKPSA